MKRLILASLILFSCKTEFNNTSQNKIGDSKIKVLQKKYVPKTATNILKQKDVLHKVFGRIKLSCDKMGKPYEQGEQVLIGERKNRLSNKFAKYRIEYYLKNKKIKEVFTDKSKYFKFQVELPDSSYFLIRIFLKSKNDKDYQEIKIDRNDDVNTIKTNTKRHIWLNYGAC